MSENWRPRTTIHFEVETEECICDRLPRCGGIPNGGVRIDCPEHGSAQLVRKIVKMHSHPVQAPPRSSRPIGRDERVYGRRQQ